MLRVAAYARVSTDSSDQLNSLENQISYFKKYITAHAEWEYTDIYVDEGISGTSVKKREGFRKMLEEGSSRKFDLLLTKEISRFARNTLDSIYYTRQLKDFGIGVIFLNDGINTLDADAELRLTIMASIAQEESRKTSVRIKWGQKRSMEQGVVFGRDLLGYKVISGKLYIDAEEAKTVKTIFHKFIHEKKGVYTIAKELTLAGIPTALQNQEWHGNVILKILKNEKYCGDLLQKKTYTPNYLLQEKKMNNGQEDKVYLTNHHEPIIERKLFEKVQEELHKRSKAERVKDKHTSKYTFSGLIKCGICGSSYVIRKKTGNNGCEYRYWKCYEQVKHGKLHELSGITIGCDNVGIADEDLKRLMMELMDRLKIDEEVIKDVVRRIPANKYDSKSHTDLRPLEKEWTSILKKKERLLNLYLDEIINKEEYSTQVKNMDLRIANINQQKEAIQNNKCKPQFNARNINICGDNLVKAAKVKEVEEKVIKEKVINEKVMEENVIDKKELEEKESVEKTVLEKVTTEKIYTLLINMMRGKHFSETLVKSLIKSIIIHRNSIYVHIVFMSEPFVIKRYIE